MATATGLDIAAEFPLTTDIAYLNHAAVGVWPKRTAEAVQRFATQNMVQGAADYPQWMACERQLRRRLAQLIHADSSDIALVKNTSEGLSLIAYGLSWRSGDNIVSTDQEFPSNRMVWESLQPQGVELRQAALDCDDPEAAIIARCDARTRLLTISSVEYGTGLRLDLARLGAFCRANEILFCVDAIQSLGALRFDVETIHADFVVADGHKWMLGPEGLALFYTRATARAQLRLLQFGWHMAERAGDFDAETWEAAASARRFEPGSPNMLGIHALNASLSLFEEVGMKEIELRLLANSKRLMAWVQAQPELMQITPAHPGRYAGIVTFRCRNLDMAGHAALYRSLMQRGVICAHRAGGIRFSPHFYSDIESLIPQFETLILSA